MPRHASCLPTDCAITMPSQGQYMLQWQNHADQTAPASKFSLTIAPVRTVPVPLARQHGKHKGVDKMHLVPWQPALLHGMLDERETHRDIKQLC